MSFSDQMFELAKLDSVDGDFAKVVGVFSVLKVLL